MEYLILAKKLSENVNFSGVKLWQENQCNEIGIDKNDIISSCRVSFNAYQTIDEIERER